MHLKRGPYMPWRRRLRERQLREAWQQAARLANTPIVHLATDENTPLLSDGAKNNKESPRA